MALVAWACWASPLPAMAESIRPPEYSRESLARTPYMGVDTWYAVGSSVDEAVATRMADAMVRNGLVAAGYRILWLDAGWWSGTRDARGNIVVSSKQWPHGMKWLTDYLHKRRIEAGIYTDAGRDGCVSPRAGSYGHYRQDVDRFAAWGFDAVKVDFCGGGHMRLDPRVAYRRFGLAIERDSPRRPLLFNICDAHLPNRYGVGDPPYDDSVYAAYSFDPAVANSWRTSPDIGRPGHVSFAGVLGNLDLDALHPLAAGPGHWNDPDYLVPDAGMTAAQAQAQFSLWTIVAAPLVLSDDVRTMPARTQAMVTDAAAIAIDQDGLGIQGRLIARRGLAEVWARPLVGGARAVALLNRGPGRLSISISLAALGLSSRSRYLASDVWARTSSVVESVIRRTVAGQSADLLRLSPSDAAARARVSSAAI